MRRTKGIVLTFGMLLGGGAAYGQAVAPPTPAPMTASPVTPAPTLLTPSPIAPPTQTGGSFTQPTVIVPPSATNPTQGVQTTTLGPNAAATGNLGVLPSAAGPGQINGPNPNVIAPTSSGPTSISPVGPTGIAPTTVPGTAASQLILPGGFVVSTSIFSPNTNAGTVTPIGNTNGNAILPNAGATPTGPIAAPTSGGRVTTPIASQTQFDTRAAQQRLAAFGFLAPSAVNGQLDATTQAALQNFQTSVGLSPTGTLDDLTIQALQQGFLTVSPGIPTVPPPAVRNVPIP